MMDRYTTFKKLIQNERQNADYRIRWRLGNSGIAILSIHGGQIEPGTTRIADAIAGQEHSFYTFEGIKDAGNRALHITSTRFDEPIAMQIVCQSEIIISIHGSAVREPCVHVGGLDAELKDLIYRELRQTGFHAVQCTQLPYGATDLKNICNLCGRGMGVQMEISRGLRAMMFRDLSPAGRHYRTRVLANFANAVRRAIAPFMVIHAEKQPLENTD
jgi:phage replication-related protein YjqB (UPF0714/DUF867 family)